MEKPLTAVEQHPTAVGKPLAEADFHAEQEFRREQHRDDEPPQSGIRASGCDIPLQVSRDVAIAFLLGRRPVQQQLERVTNDRLHPGPRGGVLRCRE